MSKNLSSLNIQITSDLGSFFESELAVTAKKQGLEMSPHACHYLARVLTKFADTKNMVVEATNDADKNKTSFPTLALMWLESLQSSPSEQYFKLQQLGDIALFTSGFFAERIDKKMLDMDYYVAMGEQAYERAGRIRESIAQERMVNVFFELASSFDGFVEVFAEVADQRLLSNDQDVLKLYERWLKSGKFRLQRMLGEAGVLTGAPRMGNDKPS